MSTRNRNNSFDSHDDFAGDVFQIKARKTANDDQSKRGDRITFFKTFWLLISLGACAGFTTALIIRTVRRLTWFHADLIHDASTDVGNRWLGYFYFCLSTTSCATVAALLCKYISREATGAGMPNVKYLLAASSLAKIKELKNQFTFKVLFVKIFGNILSAGSSLVAGNVGPFVHISACIASVLMKHVPYFQAIRKSEAISKQIYGASAAVGLSSAFNAPLGNQRQPS
jgi:H+/Cl- antiporter ClcA